MLKNAIAVSIITTGIICGAIVGIVGGACSIAGVATAIHLIVD